MNLYDAGLLAFCIALEIARELCFKRGVDGNESDAQDGGVIGMIFTRPFLWLGIGFWIVEMIGWLLVLEDVPLTIAFPIMSLVYAGIPLCGAWLLKEAVKPAQWLAAACITIGVALVGASGI